MKGHQKPPTNRIVSRFFVDGRAKERLMKPPYSKGCYQILVVPPVDGKNPVVTVFGPNKIGGMQIAGKKN